MRDHAWVQSCSKSILLVFQVEVQASRCGDFQPNGSLAAADFRSPPTSRLNSLEQAWPVSAEASPEHEAEWELSGVTFGYLRQSFQETAAVSAAFSFDPGKALLEIAGEYTLT